MPKREWPVHSTIPRVLVVGTTTDYIDWIRCRCPERALFLTDPLIRKGAKEPAPAPHEEILCNLADYDLARDALKNHLENWGLSLDGIACYDCESMELAALLAQGFSLSYPSLEDVNNCRNKALSKALWRQWGVSSPRSRRLTSPEDAARFFKQMNGPCVLKPISGSGSELLFLCKSPDECERGYQDILNGLKKRTENRLYRSRFGNYTSILGEEFIAGEEYSCDFLVENGRVEVIRLSRKIPDKSGPFGTTQGYILPVSLPVEMDSKDFYQTLHQGARALGLSRAICMLDFLIRENKMILLEMTPRPGGDCLPFVMHHCYNLDILNLNLDFAQRRPIRIPQPDHHGPYIGLRLHAKSNGILKKIDAGSLHQDPRVREIHLPRTPGHVIRMPPLDYDSWLLGHIIFRPIDDTDLRYQCDELLKKITVEVE